MIVPRIGSFAIATGCLILILALPGCDPLGDFNFNPLGPPSNPEIRSVTIVPDSVLLSVGQKDSLEAIVRRIDGRIAGLVSLEWSSSNTAVATVSSLLKRAEVTGRARGEASITARDAGGKIGRAKVIVN